MLKYDYTRLCIARSSRVAVISGNFLSQKREHLKISFEINILRRIFGTTTENRMWIIKCNEGL